MKHVRLLALLAGLSLAGGVHAGAADQVHATHAWIRVLPGTLPAGGYVTLENRGDQPVALTGARSPAYAEVMLHHSSTQGGMSRMAMVESLPIPAHGSVVLGPGGYHLMLMDLKQQMKEGDTVPMTLVVEGKDKKRSTIEVKAAVKALTAQAKPADPHSAHKH